MIAIIFGGGWLAAAWATSFTGASPRNRPTPETVAPLRDELNFALHKETAITAECNSLQRELTARGKQLDTVRQALEAKTKELEALKATRATTFFTGEERQDTIHALSEWKPTVQVALQAVRSMHGIASRHNQILASELSTPHFDGNTEERAEKVRQYKAAQLKRKQDDFNALLEQNYAAMNTARALRDEKKYPRLVPHVAHPLFDIVAPKGNATKAQADAIRAMNQYKQQIGGTGLELAAQVLMEKLGPYEQELADMLSKIDRAIDQMREVRP